jgi:hypothetical protein
VDRNDGGVAAGRRVIVVWSARATPTGGTVIDDRVFFDAVTDALR